MEDIKNKLLEMQKTMAAKVRGQDVKPLSIKTVVGFDLSNTPFDPEDMVFGAAVALSYPSLSVIETATHAEKQTIPYIRGLLGFREVPVLVQAFKKLTVKPDLLFVDGHGISHPRQAGVASHLGVELDLPTIGVAKSILVGKPAGPLPEEVGSKTPLLWKGKEIAMVVRTKKRCTPLIISAGHKITLSTAVEYVMECLKGYRLPEPTRLAHLSANACRLAQKQTI